MIVLIGSVPRVCRVVAITLAPVITCAAVMLTLPPPPLAVATGDRPAELSSPAIRETFTLLPCSGAPTRRSTLDREGCVEHQIIRRDGQIDALNRTTFTKLGDDAARRRFITGHAAWLVYRHAYCLSRSDTAEGGTIAALIDAQCTAQASAQRTADLRDFLDDLGRN
jgi:uncharacterized protein YecT (DUF1311 family)